MRDPSEVISWHYSGVKRKRLLKRNLLRNPLRKKRLRKQQNQQKKENVMSVEKQSKVNSHIRENPFAAVHA